MLRFASLPESTYVRPAELAYSNTNYDIIAVDEAAQIPVPILQKLIHVHPRAHFIFTSTVRGYEGTGRGFSLRFLEWLERRSAPVSHLTLTTPIRWRDGDVLEQFVFQSLLLDAGPSI